VPQQPVVVDIGTEDSKPQGYSLGDLSPDLKKVENYYVANINLELSRLEVSGENKALVDDYMKRLSELDEEYKMLNIELNEIGPNDQTISALIRNLQLRLQLLQKLKQKLNQLKSSENEQVTSNSV
jgi:predicted RNase H-like nuclease (RuvC/YqgF family)